MADDRTIAEAITTITELREHYRELDSAGSGLTAALERPTYEKFEADLIREFVSKANSVLAKEKAQSSRKTGRIRTNDAKYSSPVFKCHDDYQLCLKKKASPKLCMALLTICVGRQLIPFIRKA